MSALSDRIAEVLWEHTTSATRFCAGCDWDGDVVRNVFGEATGYRHGGDELDHVAHVAERVATALGPDLDLLRWLLAESLWHEQIRRDQLADAKREMNRRLCDD